MLPPNPESPAPRGTPARRRQNRVPSARSPANKAYASESDMPSELQFPIELPNGNGSPFATPQKSASNSPAPQSQSQSAMARPKARNGNKPRPKSGVAPSSPGPAKQYRKTPPNGMPIKPPATNAPTAYAGATFHASPAPSSLPLPSFLPKALDSPLARDAGRASLQPSPPLSDSEAPTPRQTSALAREVSREDSPLDLFFKADREEKERARRASTANVNPPGPYSPPSNHAQYPQQPQTVPNKQPTILSRREMLTRNSSAGRISTTELDGTPGQPMGPAFSTPYHERLRAARSNGQQPERTPPTTQQSTNQPFAQFSSPMRQAPTQPLSQQPSATNGNDPAEGLKRLLGVGSPSPPVNSLSAPENSVPAQRLFSPPGPQAHHGPPPQQYPPQYPQQYSRQYPQQYPQQLPHMPQPSGDSLSPRSQSPKSQDIARIEDHLRNLLKLDAGAGAPLTL
ncbi:hypothetical protein GE09DRAFT_694535 [Coniochaeta sp. 2T2.1]|nr:hypothetical protein GE09DRAFT_694535 [Coniochaeta sp. 2T2.1]